jgi:hypothetical protein
MKDELKKGDSLYTDQSQAKNDDYELLLKRLGRLWG